MELPEDLPIAAFLRREDPRDVLVLPQGASGWDRSKPIGSASPRRRLQLEEMFPDTAVKPVRGNVLTRLGKLAGGEYGALVLAAAGLLRLGLEERISRYFEADEMLPAAGQGILAVQCREDMNREVLACLRDEAAERCALVERAFVGALGGGCSSPVSAYAAAEDGCLRITGMYAGESGHMRKGSVSGPPEDGIPLAVELAKKLKEGRL